MKPSALLFAGLLIPVAILSTLGLALWSRETGLLPGFEVYSYVTIGAIVVSGAVGGAAVKTLYVGLVERVAALFVHQWLFVLASRLLLL